MLSQVMRNYELLIIYSDKHDAFYDEYKMPYAVNNGRNNLATNTKMKSKQNHVLNPNNYIHFGCNDTNYNPTHLTRMLYGMDKNVLQTIVS